MTKTIEVDGLKCNGIVLKKQKLIVRITKDKLGSSLSISDDRNTMLHIPIEPIEKELKEILCIK